MLDVTPQIETGVTGQCRAGIRGYAGTVSRSPALTRTAVLPQRVLAVGTMLLHMAFSVVAVLGGLLAWWQPWVLWLHLPALAWAAAGQFRPLPCPLTTLENTARERGGWPRMAETGFIDHYFTGTLYPASWKSRMPFVVLAVVLLSWAGLVLR